MTFIARVLQTLLEDDDENVGEPTITDLQPKTESAFTKLFLNCDNMRVGFDFYWCSIALFLSFSEFLLLLRLALCAFHSHYTPCDRCGNTSYHEMRRSSRSTLSPCHRATRTMRKRGREASPSHRSNQPLAMSILTSSQRLMVRMLCIMKYIPVNLRYLLKRLFGYSKENHMASTSRFLSVMSQDLLVTGTFYSFLYYRFVLLE